MGDTSALFVDNGCLWEPPITALKLRISPMARANTDLPHEFEGCSLSAYQDPGGVWTIGWGYTGPDVHADLIWTLEQANAAFLQRWSEFEAGVEKLLQHSATQGQFDALVDFAYNLGLGSLGDSTLLSKFNRGDVLGAAREFAEWVYAGNTILPGLVRRRAAEIVRFLSPNHMEVATPA